MVRGSALDWFGPTEIFGDATDEPDILLDLHGDVAPGPQRTWRVVDASGRPLLKPFSATPFDGSLVSSLYLNETAPSASGWLHWPRPMYLPDAVIETC